jgi:hypothetical protein
MVFIANGPPHTVIAAYKLDTKITASLCFGQERLRSFVVDRNRVMYLSSFSKRVVHSRFWVFMWVFEIGHNRSTDSKTIDRKISKVKIMRAITQNILVADCKFECFQITRSVKFAGKRARKLELVRRSKNPTVRPFDGRSWWRIVC